MAHLTTYLVQSFVTGRGMALKADRPVVCKSSDEARRKAEQLAATKLGVVAYSISGDAETGDYDDQPVCFFKIGRLPAQFEEQ